MSSINTRMSTMALEDQKLKSVDTALANFSNSLVPRDEFIAEGKKRINKVFELIKRKSKFNVDRVYIGGSVGKNTDIISPDFDCVLFINDENPLFEKVLQDFEEILTLDESLKIQDNIKATKCSVQFTLSDGFAVDLLPAANLIKSPVRDLGGAALAEVQRQAVMNRIRINPKKNARIYSSSLVEAQLEFMRTMDSFTHQLVRLVKFWYKSLYFGEYIPGGKTIVELIAVAAAEKEQGREKSLLRAFMKFLEYTSKIDTLKLAFVQKRDGKWEATCDLKFKYISSRANFIVEPANPFNDMAEELGRTVFEKFNKFAMITKSRFQNDVTRMVVTFGGQPYLPLHMLFEPLPTVIIIPDTVQFDNPKFICSGTYNCQFLNPEMKIRNEAILRKRGMQEFLRGMKIYLFAIVNSMVRSNPQVTLGEIQGRVQQMVDENIKGTTKREWVSAATEKHEEYDVTFTYPYTLGAPGAETNCAVILSAKW